MLLVSSGIGDGAADEADESSPPPRCAGVIGVHGIELLAGEEAITGVEVSARNLSSTDLFALPSSSTAAAVAVAFVSCNRRRSSIRSCLACSRACFRA